MRERVLVCLIPHTETFLTPQRLMEYVPGVADKKRSRSTPLIFNFPSPHFQQTTPQFVLPFKVLRSNERCLRGVGEGMRRITIKDSVQQLLFLPVDLLSQLRFFLQGCTGSEKLIRKFPAKQRHMVEF